MDRQMWMLLGWSSQYGAPTSVVGVLGIDQTETDVITHVEWAPGEHDSSQTWRGRLDSTPSEELPTWLELWQHDTSSPATEVDSLTSTADLAAAVQTQLRRMLSPTGSS